VQDLIDGDGDIAYSPSDARNGVKRRKLDFTWADLAWPLKETKVKKLLRSIQSQKETLTLALATDHTLVCQTVSIIESMSDRQ